nr:NAD(P)-binding domain-containing protein [Nitriliruptor alkaliphilus]
MTDVEVMVVGAGQAGLSAAYFLAGRGFAPHREFVVLDANAAAGGAWQHRWRSLRLRDVHGLYPLPGVETIADGDDEDEARDVVARAFARYERRFGLPVVRPVIVGSVREADDASDRLLVDTERGTWRARALINATGTWTRPFWPTYPGADRFGGRQLHTADYDGPDGFAGQHVVVVGGGHSAVQHLAELAEVTTTTWVTRRPPAWRDTPFDEAAGRAAVTRVEEAVAAGRRPSSVVSVTGLAVTPAVEAARERGVLERLPIFDRLTHDGVAWDDGRHVRADVVLWATGFRHAIDHLAPLGLRDAAGGVRMAGTQVAADPRIHLLGYGPSASTIGANRAARTAVRDLRRFLGRR